MTVAIPTGFELVPHIFPSGRATTRLRLTERVDWDAVMGDLGPEYLGQYIAKVAVWAATAAGGGRAAWPRLTGRSAASLRATVTERLTAANRFYAPGAEATIGAGLLMSDVPYTTAIERGAWYEHPSQPGKTRWRRPKGFFLYRLERRIRRAILSGRDINAVISASVTTAWRKQVRASRPRGRIPGSRPLSGPQIRGARPVPSA